MLSAGGKRTKASGNIGTAFSAAVRDSANLDVMVVEVSSFQLENIMEFRPHVSVHLNLTPDHLDRYKTMEEYEAAKWQIFRNQTADDYAIVNTNLRLPEMQAQKVTMNTTGEAADYQLIDGWLVAHGEQVLEQSRTNLIGPHNAENMLAALAVADLYKIPREAAIKALCVYKPLPHRLEKVAEIAGVTFLNDSKATNIDALEKALLAMRSPVVLLAGGKDKGLDFDGLRPLLREKVKAVVLIGQMTEKLFAAWNSDRALLSRDDAGRCRGADAETRAGGRHRPLFAGLLELTTCSAISRTAATSSGAWCSRNKTQQFPDPTSTTTKERETMDNNDSNTKSQQTGGLKLMTVFIAVLALHVVVIGGFTVYHLMSGGTDADLVTIDKSKKDAKSTDSTTIGEHDNYRMRASRTRPRRLRRARRLRPMWRPLHATAPVPDATSSSEIVPPTPGPAPKLTPTPVAEHASYGHATSGRA